MKAHPASSSKPDPDSVEAFPSLAPAASVGGQRSAPAWGAAPRLKVTTSKQAQFSDSFTIPVGDLSKAGRDGKPTSLGEVMKQVMNQYKVKIEASTNQKSRQTTFFVRSENQKALEKAKKGLLSGLSPVVCRTAHDSAGKLTILSEGFLDSQRSRVDYPRHHRLEGCNFEGHT